MPHSLTWFSNEICRWGSRWWVFSLFKILISEYHATTVPEIDVPRRWNAVLNRVPSICLLRIFLGSTWSPVFRTEGPAIAGVELSIPLNNTESVSIEGETWISGVL